MRFNSAEERLDYHEQQLAAGGGYGIVLGKQSHGEYQEVVVLPPMPEWTEWNKKEAMGAACRLDASGSELGRIRDKIRELQEMEAKQAVRVEQDRKSYDKVRERLAPGRSEVEFERLVSKLRWPNA